MAADDAAKLEEIWAGDLLERKAEAQLLVDYIESVSKRQMGREDVSSFTLAVDVGYGEGKTFFLRRLSQQLQLEHPVAFVDAWADDIADEPLTALAATLEEALKPFKGENRSRKRRSRFSPRLVRSRRWLFSGWRSAAWDCSLRTLRRTSPLSY